MYARVNQLKKKINALNAECQVRGINLAALVEHLPQDARESYIAFVSSINEKYGQFKDKDIIRLMSDNELETLKNYSIRMQEYESQ